MLTKKPASTPAFPSIPMYEMTLVKPIFLKEMLKIYVYYTRGPRSAAMKAKLRRQSAYHTLKKVQQSHPLQFKLAKRKQILYLRKQNKTKYTSEC